MGPGESRTDRSTRLVSPEVSAAESASGGARPAGTVTQFEFRHPQSCVRLVDGSTNDEPSADHFQSKKKTITCRLARHIFFG